MARKKVESKLGIGDLISLAKSGWTPTEVNALLDRMDELGDVTSPIVNEDPEEAEEESEDIEEESQEATEESEEVAEESESEEASDIKYNKLEVENTRLKKQLAKLQSINKNKDVSDDSESESIEKSLINTFQSIFN